jgi:hypothetical protein
MASEVLERSLVFDIMLLVLLVCCDSARFFFISVTFCFVIVIVVASVYIFLWCRVGPLGYCTGCLLVGGEGPLSVGKVCSLRFVSMSVDVVVSCFGTGLF